MSEANPMLGLFLAPLQKDKVVGLCSVCLVLLLFTVGFAGVRST